MSFARIIELSDDVQVLVTKEQWNDADETYEIKLRTDYDGVIAQATLGFKTEEECLKCFDEYNIEQATAFRQNILSSFIDE